MLSATGLWLAATTHAKAVTDLSRWLVWRSFNSREACWRADRSNKLLQLLRAHRQLMFTPNMTSHRYPASKTTLKIWNIRSHCLGEVRRTKTDLSRRSSKNEDGSLLLRKFSFRLYRWSISKITENAPILRYLDSPQKNPSLELLIKAPSARVGKRRLRK